MTNDNDLLRRFRSRFLGELHTRLLDMATAPDAPISTDAFLVFDQTRTIAPSIDGMRQVRDALSASWSDAGWVSLGLPLHRVDAIRLQIWSEIGATPYFMAEMTVP